MADKYIRHFFVVLKSWFWLLCFFARYFFNMRSISRDIMAAPNDGKVTVVITSCNRPNVLESTLRSFLAMNTFPIFQYIFIEDGGSELTVQKAINILGADGNLFIKNERNLGQLNSIDLAYSYVKTEYIFHLEDDWIFTNPGFIEYSFEFLKEFPSAAYLSIRSCDDQNNHPTTSYIDRFNTLLPFWKGVWVGFGFNPSLRKLKDYRRIGSKFGGWNKRETSIGLFYFLTGSRVYAPPKKISFVRHLGENCSTAAEYKKA